MTFDPVPWFVGGGAQHSPEVARTFAYAATSGAQGVVGVGDLKVTALATPGSSVQVNPGAALIRSKAAGGSSQTYVGRNPSADTVAIAATGSGAGRSDLVVARVEDPFMAGEPWQDPTDPTVGPYIFTRIISNVPASTTSVDGLNLGFSAIALARIDIPASTATITQAMITDLRKVALPRTEREVKVFLPGDGRVSNSAAWQQLCPFAGGPYSVPEWASTAVVVAHASGLEQVTGNYLGDLRVNLFGQVTQNTVMDLNWTGNPARYTFMVGGRIAVPAQYRGTTIGAGALDAYRRSGPGVVESDSGTTVVLDITFQETAE